MSSIENQVRLVQTRTLSSLVHDEIIRMMRDGDILTGEKLVEASFTKRFGINRAGIREAYRSLEEAGLVQQIKNRGVFVRTFSEEEAMELYELRACLETMAIRKLIGKIDKVQISELRKMNQDMLALARQHDVNRYAQLNLVFHDRIIAMTEHGALHRTYGRLVNQMHLLRRYGYDNGDGLLRSHKEHDEILKALAKRDEAAAVRAVNAHCSGGMNRYLQAQSISSD